MGDSKSGDDGAGSTSAESRTGSKTSKGGKKSRSSSKESKPDASGDAPTKAAPSRAPSRGCSKDSVTSSQMAEMSYVRRVFAAPGGRSLLPFVLYVAILAVAVYGTNSCEVSDRKKKDCGYPGISQGECFTV